jgi:ABC-type amino acid transport substrate-binding protein
MMQKRRQILAMAAGVGLGIPLQAPAAGDKWHVVTSHLPPLVLENSPERPGALYELVLELAKRLQLAPAMEFVPWRRALYLATTMPATAIFPLTRLPEREAQFRWLAPLYEENFIFLVRRGVEFDLEHPQRMLSSRITFLRGAAQAALLRELGYSRFVEASSIDEVHRFLLGGMADAAFGERAIVRSSLRSRGAEDDFNVSAPVRSTTAWLAGSLNFSAAEVQRFQHAKAAMTADGTTQRILRKYELA